MATSKQMLIEFSADISDMQKQLSKLSQNIDKSTKNMADKFDKNFNKMERNVDKSVSGIGKKFGGMGTGLKKVFGIVGTAVAGIGLGALGVQAVQLAGDMDALNEQMKAVFGKSTEKANKTIEKLANTFGYADTQVKPIYTQWGTKFKGLGIEMSKAMEMSERSMTMVADASAMYNMGLEEANEHMQSFINGSYEGGEAIGLFANDTQMASFAVKTGVIDETKEWAQLDEAKKQATRLEYAENMYKQSGAIGQASREADSYQTVLQKLKGVWEKFLAQVGAPILDTVAGALKKVTDALDSIPVDKISGEVVTNIKEFAKGFSAFDEVKAPVMDTIKGALKGLWEFITSVDWYTVGAQVSGFVDDLQRFAEPIWETVKGYLDGLGDLIKKVLEAFGIEIDPESSLDPINQFLQDVEPMFKWLAENGETVATVIESIMMAFAGAKIGGAIATVVGGFTKLYNILKAGGIMGLLQAIGGKLAGLVASIGGLPVVIGALIATAVYFIIKYWDEIVAFFEGVDQWFIDLWNQFKEKINNFVEDCKKGWEETCKEWDSICQYWKDLIQDVKNAFSRTWKQVKKDFSSLGQGFKDIWTWIKGLWNSGWSAVCNACTTAKNKIVETYNNIKTAIVTKWQEIRAKTVQLVQNVVNFVKSKWDWLKTKTSEIFNNLKNGIVNKWNEIKNNVTTKVTNIKDRVVNGFNTLKNKAMEKVNELKTKVKNKFDEIVSTAKQLPTKMGNAIKNGAKAFGNALIKMVNNAVSGFLKGINKLISGVNWIWEKLGGKANKISKIKVENHKIPLLAKGTNSWSGGTAIVGEAGRELVSDPRLGTFMADRPMMLPLSRGASVLRNSKTEKLMSSLGIGMFAKGKNESWWGGVKSKLAEIGDAIWDFIDDPAKVIKEVFTDIKATFEGEVGIFADLFKNAKTMLTSSTGQIWKWIKKASESDELAGAQMKNVSGNAKAWTKYIKKAASFFGDKLTSNELARIIQQINTESGGNPTVRQSSAVDDVNARSGNWARGLLQYVPSTFKGYAVKGHTNILNGYDQLLAFFNNSTWRKALPKLGEIRGWSPRGSRRKAKNGFLAMSETDLTIGEAGAEAVVPLSNATALKPFGEAVANSLLKNTTTTEAVETDVTYEFVIPVMIDGKEIAKATATFTKEELQKLEKRSSRRSGKK